MACIAKRRGRWVIDFYDQHGKRRWKTLPGGTTKGKAREEMRAIEEMVEKGVFLPAKKTPLFSEVAKDWLEYKKPRVRANTYEEYERHTKIHFNELNDLKINRITIATIERYITERQNKAMNINTLRRILVTLNQIVNFAVRRRYTDHNPLREAERPRYPGNHLEKQEKIRFLTPPQINSLLDATEDKKYKMLFMLSVFSGARQGELLGLKWSDVDWKNSQIHVQRTFNHGRFFLPKTKASNRKVDLGPTVMTELKKWKLACPRTELDLIFPSNAGTPIDRHHLVARYFEPSLKRAELPDIRFHDLRHTCASLMIEQGENIKYIQSQLGHSSPTVTWNIYAHLMKPTNQEAACRLENAVFEKIGSKMVATPKKED